MQKSISELFPPLYSEADIPAYRLPEIGSPARTCELFRDHVYGSLPIEKPEMRIDVFDREDHALGGLARRRQLRVTLRNGSGQIEFIVLLYLPALASSPVPFFLGLHFMGNHTIHADPAIVPPTSWIPPENYGTNWSKKRERASSAYRWSLEMLLRRGYGLATVYAGDFAPDDPEHFEEGALRLLSKTQSDQLGEKRGGAIAAWAWGLSRILDCLVTLPEIDSRRVAVVGFSRMGKAALWAGACDKRFSLVMANCSGSGGAALSRRRIGERQVHSNGYFPYWFAKAFHHYNEREADLPIDQHQLLALVAPRALYVASADEDTWADPRGEYLSLVAAASAWGKNFPADSPPAGQPIHRGCLGYHMRSGPHDMLEYDWRQILDFADQVWK